VPVQEKQVRVDDTMEHSFIFYQKTKQIMKNVREKRSIKKHLFSACATFLTMLLAFVANAQDGNAGINEANTKVRSYFSAGTNLMYEKWNSGDHDTGKVAAAWFGSCVFLVIVATVIRSFFGV